MNIKYINLNNRSVIEISGRDRKHFLQGLVTNDINKVAQSQAVYAVMLNPQGRFLYDFFVTEIESSLIVDVDKMVADELIKKLNFYKLRADVVIKKREDLLVISIIPLEKLNFSDFKLMHFSDSRHDDMGLRAIGSSENLSDFIKKNNLISADLNFYNHLRINLKIADNTDLEFDKSFILEYGFENFQAIDYNKGCYVGQEITARTHYRGQVRKKIYLVEFENLTEINKESEIVFENKKVGVILSSVFYDGKLKALALIKNVDNEGQEIDFKGADLMVNQNKIHLIS